MTDKFRGYPGFVGNEGTIEGSWDGDEYDFNVRIDGESTPVRPLAFHADELEPVEEEPEYQTLDELNESLATYQEGDRVLIGSDYLPSYDGKFGTITEADLGGAFVQVEDGTGDEVWIYNEEMSPAPDPIDQAQEDLIAAYEEFLLTIAREFIERTGPHSDTAHQALFQVLGEAVQGDVDEFTERIETLVDDFLDIVEEQA